ncbi:hypothetical protein TRICI_001196 [Trichomonascus ciferrii]|uniref:Uncharacterized protein n=1 Tax=Trichomonascus ciferrii TaxID=44093 RepID=A0A642V958_9ASCO|nr:hypothetical protein TRICI_001196 [Trichomonascus ciferrii]
MVVVGQEFAAVARAAPVSGATGVEAYVPELDSRAPEAIPEPDNVNVALLKREDPTGLVSGLVSDLSNAVDKLDLPLVADILRKLSKAISQLNLKKRDDILDGLKSQFEHLAKILESLFKIFTGQMGLVSGLLESLEVGVRFLNLDLIADVLDKLANAVEQIGLKKRDGLPSSTGSTNATTTQAAANGTSNGTATSTPTDIEQGAGTSIRAPKVLLALAAGVVATFGLSTF